MTYKATKQQLDALNSEICARVDSARAHVPDVSYNGKAGRREYCISLQRYIRLMDTLEREYRLNLVEIAESITAIRPGTGWQKKNGVVRLWMDFAKTVEQFRHNPVKGAGAVYVSPDNRMLGFGAASYARGMRLRAGELEPGRRTKFTICGERLAVKAHFGECMPRSEELGKFGRSIKREKKRAMRVALLEERLKARMLASKDFHGAVLFTTAAPCMPCAELIMAGKIARIHHLDHSHQPMTRVASMEAAGAHMRASGIQILQL
jgi:deoxycytidylate deaminase